MKAIKIVLTLGVLGLLLNACGENKKEKTTTSKAEKEKTSNAEIDEKQAYINKYNAYIAVWNGVSPRVERSYNSLYNIINDKTGTPISEKEKYFIPPIPESNAIATLEKILKEKPEIKELDELAPDLIASYKAFVEPLQQLSDYYKLQSYLDDDFEKSKELYFAIRPEIKRFLQASDQLGPRLQEIDNRLSTEALAEYKENDQMLLYHKGMLINSIKQHSTPLYNIPFDAYDKIDFEVYDKSLKSVIEHYTAFKELSNDENRLKKEMNISFKGRLIIYFTKIDDYVRASRELKALATNSKKYNRMKETTRTMGISFASISHEKVLKAGEGVISASNSLN